MYMITPPDSNYFSVSSHALSWASQLPMQRLFPSSQGYALQSCTEGEEELRDLPDSQFYLVFLILANYIPF